ncbi:MAG: nucleotidyl cyclase domain-containing protein [Dehalococcoidia bacterium]
MEPNPRLLDLTQLRGRIREESDRARRYGHPFGVLIFEALPASDGLSIRVKTARAVEAMQSVVRASDVLAQPYDDMLVAVLVETGSSGTHDALLRIRERVSDRAGIWRVTTLCFPDEATAIEEMSFLDAA